MSKSIKCNTLTRVTSKDALACHWKQAHPPLTKSAVHFEYSREVQVGKDNITLAYKIMINKKQLNTTKLKCKMCSTSQL